MFARLFRRTKTSDAALTLYEAAVRQGRDPLFYSALGVPDSLDGRFEAISLQVWLLLRRLAREASPGEAPPALAQELTEVFFADMDVSLREIGAADIGVGRRVKRMIEGFYGRIKAYDAGLVARLAGESALLDEALARNLYGTVESRADQRAAVAAYLLAADRALAAQPLAEVAAGRPAFPPLPHGPQAPPAAGDAA